MDGSVQQCTAPLDVSSVAGRITLMVAKRHAQALLDHDIAEADRFDISLDTIYFASLLLMVVDGSGEVRGPEQVLKALQTVDDIVADLRRWIEDAAA